MPRLAEFLGRLLPEPDLTLILEAEPGVIRARKAELPVEELARQRAVWRAVRPPGESHAYIDASQPAAAVQKQAADALARRMSGSNTSRQAAEWLAFPPVRDARWLLPRKSTAIARAGLDVYQPVTVQGRIGWEAARALASLGMFRALPGRSAPSRAVRNLVEPYVPAGGALALARTNHPGRWVALILGADGARVAVAKIAHDAEGQASLAREADNLERFGNLLSHPLLAPHVLGRSDGALVLEAIHWRPRWRPWRMSEDIAFALGAFYRALPAAVASGAHAGLSHGDVAPWNLMRADRGWVLIDWEDARTARPPFHDLMHFLAQSATLLGRPSVRELAEGVAQRRGWIGAAVAAYARGAELSADDAWPMLLAYLQDNIEDHDRRQLLETLTSQHRVHALTR